MRAHRPCFWLAVLVLALCLPASPLRAAGGPGFPLDQGLWRLGGTDPALIQEDLEPLQQVIGGAQFVGLGEAIHTSGGFYQMKARVFRFLVERMGFRALGMETPWIRAERVERYVQTCQGSARDAVRGVLAVWQSTELSDLVQWMCEWNTAHPSDRVHFFGFDIQAQALQDGEELIAFLHRLDIADTDPRVVGIRACDGVETDYFLEEIPYPPDLYQQCQEALADVAAFFDQEESSITKRTSREDLSWARVHLVGEQGWQEEIFAFGVDRRRENEARDRAMADVAQAIRDLRAPHARTVLWAHNNHLIKTGLISVGFDNMGSFLDAELGNRYTAIGLTGFDVSVDWFFARLCGRVPDAILFGANSVEQALHGLGQGNLLADLGGRGGRPPYLDSGLTYTVNGAPLTPKLSLDALIYLDVSPAMHPLAWLPCQ